MISLSTLLLEAENVKSNANSANSASPFNQDFSQRQSSKAPAALLNLTATFNSEAALRFTARKAFPFVKENNAENIGESQMSKRISSALFCAGERNKGMIEI